MSEYQYYEFLAIDRPLTSEEMAALRALSTRANITPVSFTNEYNWGDFKGTQTHWVITWSLEESENYDRFGMEDGRGWMARLAPVRDELLCGDIRSLYIGWLAAVTGEMMDEWIDGLSRDEVKAVLRQLLESKGQQAERTLKNRFAAWRRGLQSEKAEAPRRTVRELRKNAEAAEKMRLEQKKRDRKQREIKRRKEREVYLKNLSKDFPKMWKSVQQTVERGSGLAYDEACRALVDISEAYTLRGNRKRFQQELKKFMGNHMRRKALIQRMVKAGIWKDK